MAISPTVRRRRLAAELRRIRESRDLKGEQAGRALGWSASKISRYESGRVPLKPGDVSRMLDLYGVAEPERGQLLDLAHDATAKGWWEPYADALTGDFLEYVGLEAEATTMAQYHVEALPGLVQTEDYARAVFMAYQHVDPTPPGVLERRLRVRMLRQTVLTREQPLRWTAVIDEATLLRRVGSTSLMRAQLERLAAIADMPNVTLKVLPLDHEHPIFAESFAIFSFGSLPGGTMLPDIVSTEHLAGESWIEEEADTYLYQRVFALLFEAALSSADSRELIVRVAEQVWS